MFFISSIAFFSSRHSTLYLTCWISASLIHLRVDPLSCGLHFVAVTDFTEDLAFPLKKEKFHIGH